MDAATWVAIIVALFGGAGVKVVERWLSRGQIADDGQLKLRDELRLELNRLREELEKTEKELDETRARYFKLLEEFSKNKMDLEKALNKLQKQAAEAQQIVQQAPPVV